MRAPGDGAEDAAADESPRPDLEESLRQLGVTSRAGFGAFQDASKAFKTLVSADISLARSAFGRTLAFIGVAIAFGASAWLMLASAIVVALVNAAHWPWWLALVSTGVLSLAVTSYAVWRAMIYYEHTRMRATRRQLARLGFGQLADYTPDAGSPKSTRHVTDDLAATGDGVGDPPEIPTRPS